MKVKEITKRGEVRYLVDGKVNGTRQRMSGWRSRASQLITASEAEETEEPLIVTTD